MQKASKIYQAVQMVSVMNAFLSHFCPNKEAAMVIIVVSLTSSAYHC
jgi:hypothetical protein